MLKKATHKTLFHICLQPAVEFEEFVGKPLHTVALTFEYRLQV